MSQVTFIIVSPRLDMYINVVKQLQYCTSKVGQFLYLAGFVTIGRLLAGSSKLT